MGMRVDIVTLFPEMCQQVLDASIIGRAAKRGYIETHCHQIRDYTLNKQKQTDDYPYGGGCGMVLYAQPIADCLRAVQQEVAAQGGKAYKITSIRAQGQMALLQLEGVNDMDAARALRGQVFYFDRNDATLPAGRW